MLTLQALMCIEGSDRTGGEPLHPGKVAKLDGIFQLNCKECTPMQVIKQPEHGRTSTTNAQK